MSNHGSGSDHQNSDNDLEIDQDKSNNKSSSSAGSDEVPKLIWDNDALNDDFMEMAEEYKVVKDSLKHYLKHPIHGAWFRDNNVEIEQIKNRYFNLLKKRKRESNKKQKRGGK
jgi:hypothetical protein